MEAGGWESEGDKGECVGVEERKERERGEGVFL